jgi:dTDP-4-amino-4,6-dideoxygalactose transaminase
MVPAYPTLAGFRQVGRLHSDWRAWFPFNVRGGWAFSGRVALYHGVARLGLPARSTILVPAYHEGIELDALLAAGFAVRHYRVDRELRIDLADVERRIDPSVAALYVIHYFGIPQPLRILRDFCDAHRLRLIEDCALALFSRENGTWLGSVGDLAIFSLYKTLPLPHGGYLVAPGGLPGLRSPPVMSTFVQTLDLMYHTLQASGLSGVERATSRASRFVTRLLGWNRAATVSSGGSRWDPRLVTYGVSRWAQQLVRFTNRDAVVARRRANYARLAERLRAHATVPFPELPAGACPLLFPILVGDRDRVHAALESRGVQSGKFWPAAHSSCPPDLAAELAVWRERCLELPIHQELDTRDVDRVADAVQAVLGS